MSYSDGENDGFLAEQLECLECGTLLGGEGQKDTYSHMLGCLNVEQGAVHRIRTKAIADGDEHGQRVVYLCDAIEKEEH